MSAEIQMQKLHFSVVFFVFSEPVTPGSCVEFLETCQGGPKPCGTAREFMETERHWTIRDPHHSK